MEIWGGLRGETYGVGVESIGSGVELTNLHAGGGMFYGQVLWSTRGDDRRT